MKDNNKFNKEDEQIYRIMLLTTKTIDVKDKENLIYKLSRIRKKFKEVRLDKIISKLKKCTKEEFEELKERCLTGNSK